MKKLVLLLSVLFSAAASADQVPAWKQELENYKAGLADATYLGLRMRQGLYAGKALGTCALSVSVTAAAFAADTAPVTNVISETVANLSDMDYKTYNNILEWESLSNIGRGLVGGGPIAVVESLEFVVLWLGGNEAQSFEALKKTYASSIATMNSLVLSEQSQCMMSISKVMITNAELGRRQNLPSPMRVPVEVHRP